MSAAAAVWLALGTGAVSGFLAYWYAVGRTERIWRARMRNTRQTFLFLMRQQSGDLTPAERAAFDQLVTSLKESA